MKLSELKQTLAQHADKHLSFRLPTGTSIPIHAHVTEVARIEKRFIDCGGTFRTETCCRLQTWFSDDTDHRAAAKMLLNVLDKAAPFLETEDLEVDVEYEAPFISQFPISGIHAENNVLVVDLGIKHTTCLAPDKCLPPTATTKSISFQPLPNFAPTKCC